MPYELGGRADKCGNRFEIRWGKVDGNRALTKNSHIG